MSRLKESQSSALQVVRSYAHGRLESANEKLGHMLSLAKVRREAFDEMAGQVLEFSQVALHFHPDRYTRSNELVIDGLLARGTYVSQYVTGISNGSTTAYPGGQRDLWESRLFGNDYQEGSCEFDRPVYGALELVTFCDGPAPRFGSCYFLLHPGVLKRITFTYLDSHLGPETKGTVDKFEDIWCALLEDAFERESALGLVSIRPRQLLELLQKNLSSSISRSISHPGRNLDHYIEAQVHGTVSLKHDASALVVDSSFAQTKIMQSCQRIAEKYDLQLLTYPGYSLAPDAVPEDFRGPRMPEFAQRVSPERVTAANLGSVARSILERPKEWEDFGSHDELLQYCKWMWHTLVRFGISMTRDQY